MNIEAQIADLDRRVSALEKTATAQERHNKRVADVLAIIREDMALLRQHAISTGEKVEEIDARLGALETHVEKIDARLGAVEGEVKALRKDVAAMPGIIIDAMREMLKDSRNT